MGIAISVLRGEDEHFLNLPTDFSADFKYQSGLFKTDSIPGSYAMNMEIPVEGNTEALGLAHRIEIGPQEYLYDARYYKNGSLKHEGKLLVEDSTVSRRVKNYAISFLVNSYGSLIQDKTLRDILNETIDLGNTATDIATEMKSICGEMYPDQKICFPTMKVEGFYESDIYYEQTIFNKYNQSTEVFDINNDSGTSYSVLPQVYLLYALQRCFEYFGFNVNGNVFQDPDLFGVHLIGLNAIDDINSHQVAQMSSDQTFTMSPSSYYQVQMDNEILDLTDAGLTLPSDTPYLFEAGVTYVMEVRIHFGTVTGTPQVGFRFIGWPDDFAIWFPTSDEIVERSGQITFGVDTLSGLEIRINSAGTETVEVLPGTELFIYPISDVQVNWNKWKGQFNLGHCVPDLSVRDFLKLCKGALNCDFTIKSLSKTVTINFIDGKLDEAPISLDFLEEDYEKEPFVSETYAVEFQNERSSFDSSKKTFESNTVDELPDARPLQFALVNDTNSWYSAVFPGFPPAYVWRRMEDDHRPALYGTGEEKAITIAAELPPIDRFEDLDGNEILAISISASGSSEWEAQGLRSWKTYLSIYRGFSDGESGPYPFSSPYNIDYSGTELDELNLKLTYSEKGLYYKVYERWLKFLSKSFRVKRRALINGRNPEELIGSKVEDDGQLFIVEEIQERDQIDGTSLALLYLRKIN